MLEQIIDGMSVGGGQVLILHLGMGSCKVGLPNGKQGNLSMVAILGLTHIHLHQRLALLCCSGEVQGLSPKC